jgi:hypothetical protein
MRVSPGIVRSLAPVAVFVAAVGLLALWLLLDGNALGPWVLAFLLLAHGWVHVLYAFPNPPAGAAKPDAPDYPFDFERSWLIGRASLDRRLVRRLGLGLLAIVLPLHVGAALATVALVVPIEWWAWLVTAAALSSLLYLALFWSPLLLLGMAVDVALLWLVLSGAWSPPG